MRYIKFKASEFSLTRDDKTPIVSGSIDFYGIEIAFDEFWKNLPGTKQIEYYKSRRYEKFDLVEERCILPNEFIADKAPFEMRLSSGDTIATPWISVMITEGGPLFSDKPDEELPENLSFVKTPKGDNAISQLRVGETGLEYSINGIDWEAAINGIPDVPRNTDDISYLRKRGDWIPKEKGEAISDILSSPTMDDFNNLLAQLRLAGVIKEQ